METFAIYLCQWETAAAEANLQHTFDQFSNIYQQNYLMLSSKPLVLRQEPDNGNFCNIHKQERLHLGLFRGSNDTQSQDFSS